MISRKVSQYETHVYRRYNEHTGGCSRPRNAARGTMLAVFGSRYTLPNQLKTHLQQKQ